MEKCFEGKTKTIYKCSDGNFQLFFKDDMTGEDGKFDPGANNVGLSMDGVGKAALEMSTYYFELLEQKGFATQYISSNLEERTMVVKPATIFGKGLEVICRFKAMGSFIRRYGAYVEDGTPMDAFVEMTLKDDFRGDPFISQELLEWMDILKAGEYDTLVKMMKDISLTLRDDLAGKGLELCDIKLEFGRDSEGKLMLIDEISGGNMRVLENGKSVMPIDLAKKVTA